MPAYTMYNSSGEIVHNVTCPETDLAANTPPGCQAFPLPVDQATMWMPGGEPAPRQAMSPVVSGMTVTGLPTPSTRAIVEGTMYTITDGVLELDANLPGPYDVILMAPGYLDAKVRIG